MQISNQITRRPPDHCKETQSDVISTCLPFLRSGQNHLARHSERGKKTRQTEEEVGRQHQGMNRPRVHQVPEGSGEQGKLEETGCEIIWGCPLFPEVKGWMRWYEEGLWRRAWGPILFRGHSETYEFLLSIVWLLWASTYCRCMFVCF